MSSLVKSGNSFVSSPLQFTADDVTTIKLNYAQGFTDPEFSMCIRAASLLGANPLLKECHFLKQSYTDRSGRQQSKVTLQIGIDFYRRRLMESGLLRQYKIEYCDPEVNWYQILPRGVELWGARCTLKISGLDTPIERVVMWQEFGAPAVSRNPVWREKPSHMLGKVVESLTIRVVLAGLLGGSVTEDEIDTFPEQDMISIQVSDSNPPAQRPSLPAPTAVAEVQPDKTPEDAKRAVLSGIIKDAIKRIDENNAERVKATVAGMTNPGPYARTWPAFDKWSTEQLEELVELYAQLEKAPQSEPEPDATEAEVAVTVTETETASATDPVPETKAEPEPEPDLADELAPKPSEVDENGKPKAPF